MWPGIAASSAVLVLGAASTPELWVQVRLSYGSDLWVYPTIYHSTEDFCPFLFLFKGPDRIQGYMDTPDTIRSIRVDTAECTVSMQSGSSVVVDREYRMFASAASCTGALGAGR